MSDNSKKVSQLPTAANVASSDRVLVLRDPAGAPSLRTVTLGTLSANLVLSNTVPANSTANGIAGTICYSNTHLYVCVASNTWVRAELSTW